MKTIRVPLAIRSFGAVLVISTLQFSLAVLPSARAQGNFFTSVNLQSDIAGVAERTDPNLVNSWGLVINPKAQIFWVADNGSGVSTLYRPDGTPVFLGNSGQNFVTLPPTQVDKKNPSAPTGIVFNLSSDAFKIPTTTSPAPAIFLFDGEDGGIWGWNAGVNAVLIIQPKSPNKNTNSVYKGLAIANRQIGGPTLYATNFRAGTIDVFDSSFNPLPSLNDPNPPPIPAGAAGWGPFGIANINNLLYVTFAAQNAAQHDDVAGPGNGFVDVFSPDTGFVKRLINGGTGSKLNSPWGLANVPQQFGTFGSQVLLVGNFGDGHINAYNVNSGAPIGTLSRSVGPLEFNGLWALFFFDNQLYFTAGIVDEAHGLFGFIVPE